MMLNQKWFVVTPTGETSGGFFNTREAAEAHLSLGLQMFPEIAEDYQVVSGHVVLNGEEKSAALSE